MRLITMLFIVIQENITSSHITHDIWNPYFSSRLIFTCSETRISALTLTRKRYTNTMLPNYFVTRAHAYLVPRIIFSYSEHYPSAANMCWTLDKPVTWTCALGGQHHTKTVPVGGIVRCIANATCNPRDPPSDERVASWKRLGCSDCRNKYPLTVVEEVNDGLPDLMTKK